MACVLCVYQSHTYFLGRIYKQPCAQSAKNRQSHDRLINGYLNLFLFRFQASFSRYQRPACVSSSYHLTTLLIRPTARCSLLILFEILSDCIFSNMQISVIIG